MERNMKELAERAEKEIPRRYDMTLDEALSLNNLCLKDQAYKAYTTAFYYGFALGVRAAKRKRVKKL